VIFSVTAVLICVYPLLVVADGLIRQRITL
jgi:hypothetical protein